MSKTEKQRILMHEDERMEMERKMQTEAVGLREE